MAYEARLSRSTLIWRHASGWRASGEVRPLLQTSGEFGSTVPSRIYDRTLKRDHAHEPTPPASAAFCLRGIRPSEERALVEPKCTGALQYGAGRPFALR